MPHPTAIDLFCGAGGATLGLKDAGYRVLAGVELDEAAAETYRRNHPEVRLYEANIHEVDPASLLEDLDLAREELGILKSCPPCQSFSSLSRESSTDGGDTLVALTSEWVDALRPRFVLIENVPGIRESPGLRELSDSLATLRYSFHSTLLRSDAFGVPQTRTRWIGLARRADVPPVDPELLFAPLPRRRLGKRSEAAHVLGKLLEATPDRRDWLHRPRKLPGLVQKRIRAVPKNGSRFDLPENLRLTCHEDLGRHATSAYGRIPLNGPGPTMTTRCTTPSCGRFIHPSLDRPITLREAAVLQTFPRSYRFKGTRGQVERQIGNAVPARLVTILAERLATLAAHDS